MGDGPSKTHKTCKNRSLKTWYKAFPWWVFPLIGTKPLNCKAFLAACTLVTQSFTRTKAFLPWALAFFDTILPRLLRIREVLVKPPTVFSLLPRRTTAFA